MYIEKPTIIKNLSIFNTFADIILDNEINKSVQDQGYVSKEEVFKYIKQFLKNYENDYHGMFLKALRSNKIEFDSLCVSAYDKDNDVININSTYTIMDAFALIHEFIHRINNEKDNESINNPFRELLAIMHEKIFSEYLNNHLNFLDFKSPIIVRMQSDIEMAECAKFGLDFYRNKDIISGDTLLELLMPSISFIGSSFANNLDNYAYYLIGSIFSSYIHQNTINKNFNINDLKHIRDFIISKNYNDLRKVLDLDFSLDSDGFNISKDSIRVLKKEYINEVKYYEK